MATQERWNLTSVDQGRSLERNLLAREFLLAEIVRRLVKAIEPERSISSARWHAGTRDRTATIISSSWSSIQLNPCITSRYVGSEPCGGSGPP